MKIIEFEVTGLFGLYNHKLSFKSTSNNKSNADVIMIYGQNGIGKTTLLRMLEGIMTLNFDPFRKIKFQTATVRFSNRKNITVKRIEKDNQLISLLVHYDIFEINLHPKDKGVLNESDKKKETKFVKHYENDLENFSFEFIDTERLIKKSIKDEYTIEQAILRGKIIKKKTETTNSYLADKVKRFISDSQINHSRYFHRTEPELFDRLLSNLENENNATLDDLLIRLNNLIKSEKVYQIDRIGLTKEKWNKKKLVSAIKASISDQSKLNVISSYIEVLEDRNKELQNVAERLLKFETILNKFLLDKKITININGFEIKSENGDVIKEEQLSTGEYHLLYLTVLALSTKVKGTVIAIDEPEMSMHIGWQNQLVNALVEISSKAFPQMIFATHSPDIASNYNNALNTLRYE